MKKLILLAAGLSMVLVLVLPFVGGGGPGLTTPAIADSGPTAPVLASISSVLAPEQPAPSIASTFAAQAKTVVPDATAAVAATATTSDFEHVAQKAVPKPLPPVDAAGAASGTAQRRAAVEASGGSCPGYGGSANSGAPGATSPLGVGGTTSDDIAAFAAEYNSIRADNCLPAVAYFVYDSCMEARLFWMAEDPSTDPMSAWGHIGSARSDGVPSVGCDGNLAGGYGNSGSTVASKWWYSPSHQASLYRPGQGTGGVCIAFAMTHGGVPNESYDFTRAAARWISC
jgi:hypothetical protein